MSGNNISSAQFTSNFESTLNNESKFPILNLKNSSEVTSEVQDLYDRFGKMIPELSSKITPTYFKANSSDFDYFYNNILWKWLVAEKGNSLDPKIRNCRKTVEEWLSVHFKQANEIICLYPGGQMDLFNPYEHCDPDVLVIVDPMPCGKKLNSWKAVAERFCEKILCTWQDAKITKSDEFETKEISIGPSCSIQWVDPIKQKIKTLYVLGCRAGEELFKGSPVENGAHLMVTRLPTFDTSKSFNTLKDQGLALYFTPNRDGKKFIGSIWDSLYDCDGIPHVLKKSELFTDSQTIATIEELTQISESFHLRSDEEESFLKTFSKVSSIIQNHFKVDCEKQLETWKKQWLPIFVNKALVLKNKSSLLIENKLLPQEAENCLRHDVNGVDKAFTNIQKWILS